ncbi:uncharacterized protein K02A2.6-like [Actinia tenebrosa]|uniref:Uncharacterized protein K02A2.6-like n=1 Tax=Actinia tenebrosa TaxID=6105 RepID=A0A6P8J5J7_ACTTE|nr:uncharacterized protein K02A2.6-like [Actinia tenebrosa]
MPKLTFMGYLLSQKGIGTTEERAKAVKQFRAPSTASEVRSFLGLVNFSARFIPNLATIAEPLRKLTRKEVPFKSLKESLEKSEILSYFDKNAKTKVITDARPVGVGAVLVQEKDGVDRATCPAAYKSVRHELCVCGHLLLRGTRLVIPAKLRKQVVELGREGHQGTVKTKQRLRSKVWWPGLDKDAESKCKTCYECQLVSLPSPPEPVKTTKLPTEPWQDVAADLLGPMPTGEHLLVVVDYFTRFYEVVIMNSVTANSIIKALEPIFARYGYPLSIKTDNGPQFVAETFETYLKQNGIEHRRSTPYWPQANGEVERQNRSLLKAMKIAKSQGKDWRQEINTYLLAYRTTPHSTTGTSPAELMFGRKIHSKIPDIRRINSETYQEVRDKDAEMKQKNKDYVDVKRHAKESSIKVGDKILLEQTKQNKLSTNYEPVPYEVTGKFGNQVVVKSQDGVEYKRNTSQMKLLREQRR